MKFYLKKHSKPVIPIMRWEIREITGEGKHVHVRWVADMEEMMAFVNAAVPELFRKG